MQPVSALSNCFPLATSEGTYYLCPDEIIRLKACSNYTTIYCSNKKKIVSARVLKEFVQLLTPFGFVRTHRTHLVNRRHILCITPGGQVIMKDASVAEVSKRMRQSVKQTLQSAA